MKNQFLAACLSLPLIGAAATAQTTAPNIMDIQPLVVDVRPLVVGIGSLTALVVPLETTSSAIMAESKVLSFDKEILNADNTILGAEQKTLSANLKALAADPKTFTAEAGVVVARKPALANQSQPINTNIIALNRAMAEIGAKETAKEIRVNLSSDVLFDFDSAQIKPQAAAALAQTGVIIDQRRRGRVWIYGHTDAKGSDAYNIRLSGQRANAVKYWLMLNGRFPDTIFATKGWGERYPVAANTTTYGQDNPQGRARNRRVEIIIETITRK